MERAGRVRSAHVKMKSCRKRASKSGDIVRPERSPEAQPRGIGIIDHDSFEAGARVEAIGGFSQRLAAKNQPVCPRQCGPKFSGGQLAQPNHLTISLEVEMRGLPVVELSSS